MMTEIIFILMQANLPLEVARAIALKYKGLVHPMVHALRQDPQVISEGILIPSHGKKRNRFFVKSRGASVATM